MGIKKRPSGRRVDGITTCRDGELVKPAIIRRRSQLGLAEIVRMQSATCRFSQKQNCCNFFLGDDTYFCRVKTQHVQLSAADVYSTPIVDDITQPLQ